MQFNLDIDEGVAQQLEAVAKARGMSLRSVIQEILSQSVQKCSAGGSTTQFKEKTHDFGGHIESPWTVLADIESEEYVKKYAKK